ncbi:MAG: hypothetical protein IKB56_06845 [Clostridia bacterium]|nr:hypothetical protein [Clostridia bacterium]
MSQSNQTRKILIDYYKKYPKMEIKDIFKFLYQSYFGCEHMVTSIDEVIERIKSELHDCKINEEVNIERLDGEYARVPLSYLRRGLSVETFAKLFFNSAQKEPKAKERLEKGLGELKNLIKEGKLSFSLEAFEKELNKWKESGYGAISHSETYRQNYHPSYRIISKKYFPFLQLFIKIDEMIVKGRGIVAIDGGSASGKTTLSKTLEQIYDCTVFHMDDFFLRPEQRTSKRYTETGGNVDRERFLEEILVPLSKNNKVYYSKLDCSTLKLSPRYEVLPKKMVIVEGVYSMHPDLAVFYDLSVFLDISYSLQRERITMRNTPFVANRYFNEWLPLENRYFKERQIKESCDLVIDIDKIAMA